MKIAISGLSGSGNSSACENVGKALKLKIVNYTLRNLAADVGMDFAQIQEKRRDDPSFDLLLDKKQLEMFGSEGNVIMGSRLAIWMADCNLRVWLSAPLKIRAKRIATREKKPIRQVLAETKKRDEENRRQYIKLYGIDVNKHSFADIIVDADKLNAKAVAQKIMTEAKKDKYKNIEKSNYGDRILARIEKGLKAVRC
jgi:CMP/dCMP kinase